MYKFPFFRHHGICLLSPPCHSPSFTITHPSPSYQSVKMAKTLSKKKNPNSPPSKSGTSRTWGILNTDEIQNKGTKPNKEDPQERSDNDPARKRGSKGGKQGFFFFLYQFLLLS